MTNLTSSNEPLVFSIKEHAQHCVSRWEGEAVRGKIIELHQATESSRRIVIDAALVEVMTPSFADECFGRLASALGLPLFKQRFTVRTERQEIRDLISSVIRNRIALDSNSKQSA